MAFVLWFVSLLFIVMLLAYVGMHLYFVFTTRSSEEEKLHQDAEVVADMSREILGFPSGIEVKSRLIHLKNLSRAELFMETILIQRQEDWATVMNRMTARFERVDDELFSLMQLSKRRDDEVMKAAITRLFDAHEGKLKVLNLRLSRLFSETNGPKFVSAFLELNENLLSYRDQIRIQSDEVRRMLRPDAPMAADFIREALASS